MWLDSTSRLECFRPVATCERTGAARETAGQIFSAAAARAHGRNAGLTERAQARGIADGRGPQDGQVRTLFAFRGSLRSEADAGAGVLRRVEHAGREGAEALGGVRAARNGEAGRPEAQ